MALVEVRNLVKIYRQESLWGKTGNGVRAVDGVSLQVEAGETLGLVGESGCGKSTLGRLILRLVEPTSGEILFDGQDLMSAKPGSMRKLRRHIQIVFQDPYSSLNPRMRIKEIIEEPAKIHGGPPLRTGTGFEGALSTGELLRAVGLDDSVLNRYPHEFSGGQRQRIAIARALALRPKFIVADEPVSSLDVSLGAQIVNLLQKLQRDFGLTYLFISHSMPVVRYLANRIAVMYAGKIVEVGATDQIIQHPIHPYTQNLLSATPQINQ